MRPDPANLLKTRSQIYTFESCEIWLNGADLVVDARWPLDDLKRREFGRPRLVFQNRSYYVADSSRSSSTPKLYRYVLAPWPANDELPTREIHLNQQYFRERGFERGNARVESFAFKSLVIFYPVLGFWWSPQKRVLNRIGFEAHAISSLSVYVGFVLGFACGAFLVIFEFGAKTFSLSLFAGMLTLMVDAVARYDRLLRGKDQVPPGFYEWLLRRKDRYE